MFRKSPLVVIACLLAATPLAAQTHGSICTTDGAGQCVEGNLYQLKRDVYLAGGAEALAPCSSSQLADGDYYFQVTDPSGSLLLSKDGVEQRWVSVSGGVVTSYLGRTHATRDNGPCGALTVRLTPFVDTPISGCEYMLWLTRVSDYDPTGGEFFGFRASRSATESFAVDPSGQLGGSVSIISGFKFFDHDENGVWDPQADPLEVPIAGWRVEILRNGVLDGVTYTGENGKYRFIRPRDGTTYTIREIAPGGFVGDGIAGASWVAHTPREGQVIANVERVHGPDFGNVSVEVKPLVGRTKGFWHNQNGRALLEQCDPQWRDALTTRNGGPVSLRRNVSSDVASVSVFTPLPLPANFDAAFDDWSDYVVGKSADGHAGYMLSTQVAAAMLSNSCGFMQFNAYIDRFQNGILVPFSEMLDGALGLLNEPGAGLTGPHDPYQDLRDRMLGCVNEFGSINNTGDPNAHQTVWGTTDSPGEFITPY